MTGWLELSANKLRQSYVQGFIDISGGGLYLRNDLSINFYDNTGSNIPKFSIKSDSMRIPDIFGDYYDLSTSQLLYLKDISQNIQTQLTSLVSKTKHITSDATNIDTLIKLDGASKNITVHGNILPASAYGYDLGSAALPFGSLFLKNSTIHLIDSSSDEVTASISYDSSSGSLFLSTATYSAPLNNTQYVDGVLQTPVLSYDGKVGIGISNPTSTLDISGSVNVTGDASFNGNVLINQGNVIIGGSLVIGDTIYEKGIPISTKYVSASNPVVTGNSTLQAVLIKQSLEVQGDSSLNGRLFVGKDASMNANLYVAGNLITATPSTTDSSTLVATTEFVKNQGYATLASPAFTGTATLVNGNISQKLFVSGDVSMNSKLFVYGATNIYNRLFVSNDTFLSARLNVTGDASFTGIILAPTQSITDNSTKVATTAYVKNQGYATLSGGYFMGDVSFGSRLFILGDVSMSNSLYIGGDVSVNGNLTVVTQSISDNSTKVATTAYVKNQGYATLASPAFTGTATLQSVSISQALLVSADSTFIGNLNVNGNLTTNTQFNSDNSTKVATTQFVKNQGYAALSSPTFTGSVTVPTMSVSKNVFVTGDVSLNSRLYVAGDVSLNGNVNIDGILTTITQVSNDNSLKVATTEFVKKQGYAALAGANFIGDISLNTRLFVGGDVSLNSNLMVTNTTTLLGNTYAITPNIDDNSTKVATTEYVKNQGYATLASPEFTGVPIAPTPAYGDNSTQVATTEFVTTQLYSFINSNQEVYTALQSLSTALNETDASFATTLASSVGLKADKASPVFTGTVTLPILNAQTNIFSLGDVSFNGKLFVGGDISTNGNVSAPTPLIGDNSTKMATTAFVKNQGYAQLSGASFTGNLVASNQFTVSGNTILNNYLSVLKDTALNGNLSLAGQATVADIVTLLSRLIVGGDVSMNGNLSVNGTTKFPTPETDDSSTKVATTDFVKNQGYAKLSGANFTGDVSMNSKLFIGSDVSMNSKLSIGSDVSMNSKLFVSGVTTLNDKLSISGDVSMNSNLMVGKTIYENGTALINKYATLASPTFTGDVSGITKTMVGLSNVDNTSDINKPVSTLQQTALNLKSNIESPTFTGTVTAPNIDISNNLIIRGDASLNSRLYVSSDTSMNGNLSVGGSIMVPTPSITDNSNKVATTAYVQGQGFVSSTGGNFTGDVSFNNNMTIGGDLSLNGRLFVAGDSSVNANISILGKTTLYDDLSLNGHLSVGKDVSFNSKVSIVGDVSLNGNMKINGILKVPTPLNSDNSTTVATTAYVQNQGYAKLSGANFKGDVSMNKSLIVIGDTSLNSKLFVSGDLSLNSRLLLAGDSTLNGNVYIKGKSTIIGDVSMDTHLSIGKDVSMNGNLLVKGDLSLNGSLNVAGIFNALTQTTTDNSTKVATTAFVKNQGYATTSSPIFTGTTTTASLIISDNLISNADAYMQNDLFVSNDTTIGGNVSVTGYIISTTPSTSENSTTVATTAFVKSQPFAPIASPIFTGRVIATNIDISSNLVVIGDTSMNGNMNIAGIITSKTPSTTDNSTTVATTAFVKSQPFAPLTSPTFTGTVIVTNIDVSSNLVMGGDISMNGNLNVGGKIYESGISLESKYATLVSPTFTGTVSGITKSMIDLSNVDNTADINKPVSTAQQTALNLKANITSPIFTGTIFTTNIDISSNLLVVGDSSMNGNLNIGGTIYESGESLVDKYATLASPTFIGTVSGITKSMIDLSNVDNTSDINKPVSTAQQTALNLKSNIESPIFTGRVIAANIDVSSNLLVVGDSSMNGNLNIGGKIYESGESLESKYATLVSPTFTGTVSGITKSMIDLSNVNNTSDLNKPVSTAQQTALNLKANIASPTFTGTIFTTNIDISNNLIVIGDTSMNGNLNIDGIITSKTPSVYDSSTKVATTAYVQNQSYAKLSGSYFTGDVSMSSNLNVTGSLIITGTTTVVTPISSDNSTRIATTAYVQNQNFASLTSPIFTGVPTAPTMTSSEPTSTQIATTKYVENKIIDYFNTASTETLNAINQLSAALSGTDASFASTLATQLAVKADIANPIFTGIVTIPTANVNGNFNTLGDSSMNGNVSIGGIIYEGGTALVSKYATLESPTFTGTVGGITKSMITGLSNVDNTADIYKPISTAQQTALNLKANIVSPTLTGKTTMTSTDISTNLYVGGDASMNGNLKVFGNLYENGTLLSSTYATLASPIFTGTVSGITKSMVDLSNVDNTSDINKPISTAQQTALNLKANIASPSFTGSAQIAQGLYVGGDASMNGNLKVSGNLYENGTLLSSTYATLASPIFTGTVSGITKSMVDLSNVDNTSDINKPVSTAQQSVFNLKANIASPSFTGSAQIAQGLYVGGDASINGNLYEKGKLLSSTYATLASPIFTGTVSGITKSMVDLSNVDNTSDINKPVSIAQQSVFNLKANIASPSFTGSAQIAQSLYVGSDISLNGRLFVTSDVSINGTITTITPVTSDNSNKVATTAYVKSQNSAYASLTGATFTGDISINTKLFVGSDVSLNGRLFIGGDLSVNGNIRGNFPSNSIPSTAIIGGLGTNVDLSSNQTIYGIKTFVNDVSMSGRLFLTGNMVAIGNNIVSNVYQLAVDPSVNTISNLLKITDNSYGTYINDLEISKANGLMVAYNTTGGKPVLTRDGGASWSTVGTTGTNASYNAMLCISPYGRIILKQEYNTSTTTPSLYISTDWGVTYTAITLAQSIIYTNAYYGYNTYNNQSYAFSQDGNVLYFLARDTNNTIALWKNTDASFNSFTKQGSWNYTLTNCPRAITTSGNGQYVLAITGINNSSSMFLYQSSNYGVTFTKTVNSLSSNWNSIAVSYSGQYQTAIDNNKVYQSSDYGITWSISSSTPTAKWNFISMSNNGKNRVACIDNSYQYITLDYGSTWSVVPNSFGNWKKAVMTDISNDNSIIIFSHDGTNIYKNYYNYEDKLQSTAINSDLNINTPYHYLNNIGKQINTIKSNYFINYSGKRAGISNDGKYIVLPVVSTAPIMSQDYGSTWYYVPGLSSITDFKYAVASGNGQYMFIRKGSITYWSTNYGISWSLFTGVMSTDNTNGIAISNDGKYMVYAGLDTNNNSSIFISSNYGSTWTLSSAFTTSNTNFSATMSTTGQYISVLSTNSYVLSSSDYGVTWIISYNNALLNCNQICMSSSGKYQTIVSSTSIFMSSNYGVNFTAVHTGAITPGFTSVTMIGSGEYQYAVNENNNQLYISSNYGSIWSPVYTNRTSPSNTIVSSDGKVMLYSASGDIQISRVADNTGSINSTAISITHKGIVSALDLSVNGTITTNSLVVNEIYENGNLLATKYSTIDSPIFTGTVSGITSSMIGLSNVDNTSDINKPISSAQQTALNLKANSASPSLTGTTTIQKANISNSLYVVGDVSMGSNLLVNGDVSFNGNLYANYASNTIPIDAIKGGIPSATGIFSYDISANLRLYVNGDVSFNSKLAVKNDTTLQNRLFVIQDTSMSANLYVAGNTILNNSVKTNGNLIVTGNSTLIGDVSMSGNLLVTGAIYEKGASLSTTYAGLYAPNITGTATFEKVVITDSFIVSTDSTINGNLTTNGNVSAAILYEGGSALINKYATLASPIFTGTVSGITQSMVGLSNVNNTSDMNKPISTTQQSAIDLKSNLESPTFTGTPLAPTPNTGTNTSQIATTAYVRGEIYSLIGSAPTTLNTLQELAEAINSDASFATTVTTQISLKAPLLNPTFTGTIITPDISITKRLYLTGDASMISRLYVGSDASFNANVYVSGSLTINSSFSTNGNFGVGGDLSVNGNITGNYPQHSIPSSAISNLRNQYGSFQISTQRADVVTFDDEHFELSRSSGDGAYVETIYAYDSDLSLNGNLYINGTGSSIFTNNVALESNLSVTNDSLLNGNLYVGSNVILANDVSMNNNLDLSGSLIAHNNVNVYGIINQYTLSLEDGYKVDYTSYETTVESLKSQVETLQAQLATVLQILANNNLV